MIDKNLFLHDFAVVALLRDGDHHYLKEWLDYHLAAGVDYFFLYDGSTAEDVREVLKPYINEQQLDCFVAKGETLQLPVYNDAIHRFKFACRYMAFIDVNEFLFPKTEQSVVEVVDEILSKDDKAVGLAVNWQVFGSNGQETADYSKGVLERFTRRAPSDWFEPPTEKTLPIGNIHVKSIVNPRYVRYILNPHYAYYFEGRYAVNTAGERVPYWGNEPILTDKFVVNCYLTKSKEEFQSRSDDMAIFEKNDRNDIQDDDILIYRDLRAESYTPPKNFEREEYFQTLEKILLPAVRSDTPDDFFNGKLEMFLVCRSLAGILRRSFPKDNRGRFLEEGALRCISRTHKTPLTFAEIMLMLDSLPQILALPYPVVADILANCMSFVQQIMRDYRKYDRWQALIDMSNYLEILAAFNSRLGTKNQSTNS